MALIATIFFISLKAQSVAGFDELTLSPKSFWNGSDGAGKFKSSNFIFENLYIKDWQSWSGFAYSNMTDVTTSGYGNQYSAITGKGYAESANYAVCYPSPTALITSASTSKTSGFYITNSTYAYLSMKNGDMFAKKFGGTTGNDPDYFKLMIEALNTEGKPVDTVYFYLADFRFTDNSKDYILNKWYLVDLSTLKETNKLRFSLSSSDNSFGYMNTPGYFCLDDLNGTKPYEYRSVTAANFENVSLGASGYYDGSDKKGEFLSGNFRFLNSYNADWASWSGFAVSSKTDTKTAGYGNQYSAITGKGVAGTPTYAVGYPTPVSTILFKDTVISGVYVTNSTYAFLSMKNGDAFSKKFGGESGNDPDFLILTIEGFNSENKATGKVEFFLADFGYSISSNDYILDSWKWVNLSKLGRISKLEFSLRSSDTGAWGMNTPGYFCLDNLNREIPLSTPEIVQMEATVYPNPFSDYLIIKGIKDQANVTVSDMTGKIVAEYSEVLNNQIISNLGGLNPGAYLIRIHDSKNQYISKLIKK